MTDALSDDDTATAHLTASHRRRLLINRLALWCGLVVLLVTVYLIAYRAWFVPRMVGRISFPEVVPAWVQPIFAPAIDAEFRWRQRHARRYLAGVWQISPLNSPFDPGNPQSLGWLRIENLDTRSPSGHPQSRITIHPALTNFPYAHAAGSAGHTYTLQTHAAPSLGRLSPTSLDESYARLDLMHVHPDPSFALVRFITLENTHRMDTREEATRILEIQFHPCPRGLDSAQDGLLVTPGPQDRDLLLVYFYESQHLNGKRTFLRSHALNYLLERIPESGHNTLTPLPESAPAR